MLQVLRIARQGRIARAFDGECAQLHPEARPAAVDASRFHLPVSAHVGIRRLEKPTRYPAQATWTLPG